MRDKKRLLKNTKYYMSDHSTFLLVPRFSIRSLMCILLKFMHLRSVGMEECPILCLSELQKVQI